jgi:predicted NBD/HSP70 family sugar kinase
VKKKKILVIDIGGTHVKLMLSRRDKRKFDSGPRMTPKQMVAKIKEAIAGWNFNAISIGFPAPVRNGRITR